MTSGLDQPNAPEGSQRRSAALSAKSISETEGVDAFQALQRVLYRSAKQDPKRLFHALYDKLTRRDVMWRAWVSVATNRGAPGIDGVTIASIEDGGSEGVGAFLDALAEEVRTETYRPKPLRRVNIPKPGQPGKTRPLSIPNVADRVAQTAAAMLLEEKLEPIFHPDSYGYRPGRSAHDALAMARKRCWSKDWVIDLDIRAFFKTRIPERRDDGRTRWMTTTSSGTNRYLSGRDRLRLTGQPGVAHHRVWQSRLPLPG